MEMLSGSSPGAAVPFSLSAAARSNAPLFLNEKPHMRDLVEPASALQAGPAAACRRPTRF
jgi:hypothetical protein